MTKDLQDLAWSRLPKEFKEEVKFEYYRVATKAQKDEYDLDFLHAHEGMFGIHNLTSDAEGEEMLTVSRDVVRMLYDRTDSVKVRQVLEALFGSKCLPDNVESLHANVESLHANVESLEPKFKVGDKVKIIGAGTEATKARIGYVGEIVDIDPRDFACFVLYPKGQDWIRNCDLEPYTEPKENIAESRKTSQNCDKEFDNILKDSFSKERRLNIAAMMAQAILTRIDDTPQAIADAAFRHADTLIAESEKGDTK